MIHRVHLDDNFTQLPNDLLRDKSISFKARGILCMILSNRHGWNVSKDWLQEQGQEGREAIRSAYVELERAGYIRHERLKDAKTGLAMGSCWHYWAKPRPEPERTNATGWRSGSPVVTDSSACANSANLLLTGANKPTLRVPGVSATPHAGNKPPSEDYSSEHQKTEEHPLTPKGEESLPDGFAQFWEAYPKKVAKPKALKSWQKIKPSKETQALIMAVIHSQVSSPDWTRDGGQYIPHPATFLNQERWKDEASPSLPAQPPPPIYPPSVYGPPVRTTANNRRNDD